MKSTSLAISTVSFGWFAGKVLPYFLELFSQDEAPFGASIADLTDLDDTEYGPDMNKRGVQDFRSRSPH